MVLYYKFMIRDLVMHEIHSNEILFANSMTFGCPIPSPIASFHLTNYGREILF